MNNTFATSAPGLISPNNTDDSSIGKTIGLLTKFNFKKPPFETESVNYLSVL